MRFLFVGNFYPPHHVGGYELHCARVAEWLVRAGHAVRVLTSGHRSPGAAVPWSERETPLPGLEVRRELALRYWRRPLDAVYWAREWRDVRRFRRHLAEFAPDVVVLWNMSRLASGIVLDAQRRAPALAYHLMDEWAALFTTANGLPQFWARPARSPWSRLLKPPLRRLYRALLTADASAWRPRHAVLVSRALGRLMEEHGVRFERSLVSYITYDPALFEREPAAEPAPPPGGPVRFLWAGRMCEAKGLRTTLDALDRLHAAASASAWTVDFCGPADAETESRLLAPRLATAPWRERVRWLGALPHAAMPAQYAAHDVFLFTSEVHEGLPGTLVEAFASGLAVVGTLTGGTNDVLDPGANCLTYPIGDAGALAAAMLRLIDEPALRATLASGVRQFARERFSSDAVFPRLLEFYASCRESSR